MHLFFAALVFMTVTMRSKTLVIFSPILPIVQEFLGECQTAFLSFGSLCYVLVIRNGGLKINYSVT